MVTVVGTDGQVDGIAALAMLWWPYSTETLQLCFKYQWNPLARATPDEPEIAIGPPAGEACSTKEGADDSMDAERQTIRLGLQCT